MLRERLRGCFDSDGLTIEQVRGRILDKPMKPMFIVGDNQVKYGYRESVVGGVVENLLAVRDDEGKTLEMVIRGMSVSFGEDVSWPIGFSETGKCLGGLSVLITDGRNGSQSEVDVRVVDINGEVSKGEGYVNSYQALAIDLTDGFENTVVYVFI